MQDKSYMLKGVYRPDSHTLADYQKRGGYEAIKKVIAEHPRDGNRVAQSFIDMIIKANLLGRGGAGFPCGVKWNFIPKKYDGPKYLIVNSDESEPGTFKDALLIERDPHMMIEGIIIACWAVGVEQAFIFMRGEFKRHAKVVRQALKEAEAAGFLGKDACGTKGFNVKITTALSAGAYICGEEMGLISALEGKRAYPRNKPPFPANPGGGYLGHPTVVNNVETLSNLPFIVRNGLDWFLKIGKGVAKPAERPPKNENHGNGTKIVCVSGHVERPGVYEVELGLPLMSVINDFAGGMWKGRKLKAVIPGGSSAKILTAAEAEAATYSFYGLSSIDTMLGSGAVIVLDEQTCMVDALYNLVRFYHHESCGQCTPCREGCGWMEKIMHRIFHGEGRQGDVELLDEICKNGVGKTVCALFDAAAFPVWSYTKKFREEFDYFIKHKKSMVRGESLALAGAHH